MTLWPKAALAASLIALTGCAAVELPTLAGTPSRGNAEVCLPLLREFDRLALLYSDAPRPHDDLVAAPALMRQGNRLLRAGCLARSEELDRMASAPRTPVRESGARIRPIALHAGVVQGLTDEARVRTYFAERGVRVRSIGNIAIGRRIYLGPFATEGGLQAAAQAAREAGFVAPYPAFF